MRRALLGAAIKWAKAKEGILLLTLMVAEGNDPAVNLYHQAGFKSFGVEPMGTLTPRGFKDTIHMWLPITRGTTAA